ncbi:hypothetical protein ACFYSH_17770 [Streptomyces sp. NPDC005791]|uniref:MmyB family transcriptional regulator n=1 Tax=Streptomyces sp. NPDC005791 TaxID=3364732 RepID=UPI0036931667
MGHALFASHIDPAAPADPDNRPNLARLVFLDPHTRALYADWPRKAGAVVENLRMTAGRHPDDTLLTSLVGELTMKSPEFAAMWADHKVSPCDSAVHEMHHPLVGSPTVTQQSLRPPQDEERHIVLAIAEPDSPSHTALRPSTDRAARPDRTWSGPRPCPAGPGDGRGTAHTLQHPGGPGADDPPCPQRRDLDVVLPEPGTARKQHAGR